MIFAAGVSANLLRHVRQGSLKSRQYLDRVILGEPVCEFYGPPTHFARQIRTTFRARVPFKVSTFVNSVFALSLPPMDSLTNRQLLGINFNDFFARKLVERTSESGNENCYQDEVKRTRCERPKVKKDRRLKDAASQNHKSSLPVGPRMNRHPNHSRTCHHANLRSVEEPSHFSTFSQTSGRNSTSLLSSELCLVIRIA